MKRDILYIAFFIMVAVVAGCQQKADNNPPSTNGPDAMPVPTNSMNTNGPAGTNQ